MSKEDTIKVQGKIIECMRGATFKIELPNNHIIIGHISGKLRKFNINILLGDIVEVEMSPYDLTKGRITYRIG